MGAPIYTARTSADVALAAATAKSILGIRSGAAFGLLLKDWRVAFDGVAANAEPVVVELCYCDWQSNVPGTASTSETPVQGSGRVLASGVTAARDWTSEPTALTVLESFPLLHPQAGGIIQLPLGDEYDCGLSDGFVVRCTAPSSVNARGFLKFSRC